MRSQITHAGAASLLLLATFGLAGCYEFHLTGPEDPDPVDTPQLVSVTVEYWQVAGCQGEPVCKEPVNFQASWMQPGAEFSLVRDPANQVWRGTAYGVPVNFPPRGAPYYVRVYDPMLRDRPNGGKTGERLTVGGEAIRKLVNQNTTSEFGTIFIDTTGRGHNVY